MRKISNFILLITLLGSSCLRHDEFIPEGTVLHISQDSTMVLYDHVFGHFLEKCNWGGESGADVIWDSTNNQIRRDVEVLMDSLHMPIVRFPGGTDVDYYQWTELIDNAYDRKSPERSPYDGRSGRIVSQNELGIDEFLQLAERLDFDPLLVVNLVDAYFGKKSVEEAAEYAAALVAYCNVPVDADLPEKYLKWAELRAKNGHEEPYNVPYFQVGNEVWLYGDELERDIDPIDEQVLTRYLTAVSAYTKAMKRVDPEIKIIIEGGSVGLIEPSIQRLKGQFDMMAFHHYTPWGIRHAIDTKADTLDSLSPEELYYAMVSVPYINPQTGQSQLSHFAFEKLLDQKVPVAVTEWNWNGWVTGPLKKSGSKDSKLAQGLGAASFLHSFMRHADVIKMANQSMLAGNSWGINTIRVDSVTEEAMLFPTGLVTGLYARYHGDRVVKSSLTNNAFYTQPYTIGIQQGEPKVAYLDVVVSESDNHYYIHVINRDYSQSRVLKLDPEDFSIEPNYKSVQLSGEVYAEKMPETAEATVNVKKGVFEDESEVVLDIDPHTVTVFVLEKS